MADKIALHPTRAALLLEGSERLRQAIAHARRKLGPPSGYELLSRIIKLERRVAELEACIATRKPLAKRWPKRTTRRSIRS